MDTHDKAIEILRKTHDGDALAPNHLHLIQLVVNCEVDEAQIKAFEDLYIQVSEDRYSIPWLQGIEYMTTRDGFIYYKGHEVEHYDYPYDPKNRDDLLELAQRCQHLESLGVPLDTGKVIWRWDWFSELIAGDPWGKVLGGLSFWESAATKRLIVTVGTVTYLVNQDGSKERFDSIESVLKAQGSEIDEEDFFLYDEMRKIGFGIPQCGQPEHNGVCYAKGADVIKKLQLFGLTPDLAA